MNNQQKLLILTALVGVSAIGLLFVLSRKRAQDEVFENGEGDDMQFADLTADETVASASETIVNMKVPVYAVGLIIGKGGQNIRQLKKETGARLDFERVDEKGERSEKSDKEERILEIRGNRDRVLAAEIKIRQLIADTPPIITTELIVPQDACGRIIGRGGQVIREMCQISGARILVDKMEDRSLEGKRTVKITGNTQQIEYAKGLIAEKVEMGKLRSGKQLKMNHQDMQQSTSSKVNPKYLRKRLPGSDGYFEVFLSAFDVPSHIYVQLVTPESQKLDQLVEDMTAYYSNLANSENKQLINGVTVGDIYCAPFDFDELWYRACVLEINSSERMAVVYYIDFGDTCKVSLDDLSVPKPEFLELEAQAIECCLAGIEPKGGTWSDDAIRRFDELSQCAQWSVLMARELGFQDTANGRLPCLELIDTKHDEEINLAETMIKEGFAEPRMTASYDASNDQIVSDTKETTSLTANNNAQKNLDNSQVTEMTIQPEECIQEVMSLHEFTEPPEVVQEEETLKRQDITENAASSLNENIFVQIVEEIPDLEDLEEEEIDPTSFIPDSIPQFSEQTGSKRNSADTCSLSSNSTEDTVIQVKSKVSKEEESDVKLEHSVDQISQAVDNSEVDADHKRLEATERAEVRLARSAGESVSTERSEVNVEDGAMFAADVTKKATVKSNHKNEEVNKWIESSLEQETEAGLNESHSEADEHAQMESSDVVMEIISTKPVTREDTHPNRITFQNSMELSKENPIILSDDEDSLSYMSARSELTIADTDTLSYKSAPDTPTNIDSFEFPTQRDSTLDYDIITTPVGSDDESLATPHAFGAAKIESATPINVKTPKYQIRIVEETPTPTRNGGSLEALSDRMTSASYNRQEPGKLSSSPQRISKLSASTPQFGELKTSQSRFGGSGSMIGKETSI